MAAKRRTHKDQPRPATPRARRKHEPYQYRPAAPPATYKNPDGSTHNTDGTCHTECRDWR